MRKTIEQRYNNHHLSLEFFDKVELPAIEFCPSLATAEHHAMRTPYEDALEEPATQAQADWIANNIFSDKRKYKNLSAGYVNEAKLAENIRAKLSIVEAFLIFECYKRGEHVMTEANKGLFKLVR